MPPPVLAACSALPFLLSARSSAESSILSSLSFFAVYLLANKERLARNIQEMMAAYMKHGPGKSDVCRQTADNTFSRFIVGQCTEAVILVSLYNRHVYIPVPLCDDRRLSIGATALIPIVGAYLGAALGAFYDLYHQSH